MSFVLCQTYTSKVLICCLHCHICLVPWPLYKSSVRKSYINSSSECALISIYQKIYFFKIKYFSCTATILMKKKIYSVSKYWFLCWLHLIQSPRQLVLRNPWWRAKSQRDQLLQKPPLTTSGKILSSTYKWSATLLGYHCREDSGFALIRNHRSHLTYPISRVKGEMRGKESTSMEQLKQD